MHPLREYRQKNGVTMQELARELGTSQPHISDWESGKKRISMPMADRLEAITGIAARVLTSVGREDIQHPLSRWRWANGLSQREFARRLGCDNASVSGWESGKTSPSLKFLLKIRDLTDLGPEAFEK